MRAFRALIPGACLLSLAAAQSSATLDELGQMSGPSGSTSFGASVRASPATAFASAVDGLGVRKLHRLTRSGLTWVVEPALPQTHVLGFDGDAALFAMAYENPIPTFPRKVHVAQRVGDGWVASTLDGQSYNNSSSKFGETVAVAGDAIAVSEPWADVGPPPSNHSRGRVHFHLFRDGQRIYSTWFGGSNAYADLGSAVDLSRDLCLASFQPSIQSFNYLRAYRRVADAWQLEQAYFELPWGNGPRHSCG